MGHGKIVAPFSNQTVASYGARFSSPGPTFWTGLFSYVPSSLGQGHPPCHQLKLHCPLFLVITNYVIGLQRAPLCPLPSCSSLLPWGAVWSRARTFYWVTVLEKEFLRGLRVECFETAVDDIVIQNICWRRWFSAVPLTTPTSGSALWFASANKCKQKSCDMCHLQAKTLRTSTWFARRLFCLPQGGQWSGKRLLL